MDEESLLLEETKKLELLDRSEAVMEEGRAPAAIYRMFLDAESLRENSVCQVRGPANIRTEHAQAEGMIHEGDKRARRPGPIPSRQRVDEVEDERTEVPMRRCKTDDAGLTASTSSLPALNSGGLAKRRRWSIQI